MEIREYRPQDCEELAKLFYHTVHTVNAKDYTEEQLNAWANKRVNMEEWNRSFLENFTLVAEEGGRIVGFGDMNEDGYLNRLYIHPGYQRQGIARALCDRLEQRIVKRIETHASITARPFFEKRGYRVVKVQEVIRDGVALTNYVMEKRVDLYFFFTVMDHLDSGVLITDSETNQVVYMNQVMKLRNAQRQPGEGGQWEKDGISEVDGRFYRSQRSSFELDGRLFCIHEFFDMTQVMQITENASIDELTSLLNRRAGKERLGESVEKAREENVNLTVALYDVNELKQVNDRYGHSEGDRLLRFVSSMTMEYLGETDYCFRLSGDEFVVVFWNRDLGRADEQMRRILGALKERRDHRTMFYEVSFSYGLVEVYPGDQYTVSDIISRADDQMYIQKRDYHIRKARKRMLHGQKRKEGAFDYDRQHLYELVAGSLEDYIFVGNLRTGTFRYPPQMAEEFGLPGEIVENAAVFWGKLIHPDDEQYFLERNQEIADGRADYHDIEYRAKNCSGEWIWLRCRGRMSRDAQGIPWTFAGAITNLGKKNQLDHMTGLSNKYEFEGYIKKYLVDDKSTAQIGIMILDMDSFKNINDLYDRAFGDEVLRITAQKITAVLPCNARLFRLDGDEFGIAFLNEEENEHQGVFSRIQRIFLRQQEYGGRKYFCTISAGYASCPQHAGNYLDLLKYANYSLEYSKSTGKNRLTEYSDELLRQKERSLKLTELLRESMDRGFAGFDVHYQPQLDMDTGKLYGAEALLRWRCEEYGEVTPGEFVPILENNGLIVRLGEWIFGQAAAQCCRWRRLLPDFHMSINLSYRQLLEGDTLNAMKKILHTLELPPASITMELTETYLMKEDSVVRQAVEEMQKSGLRIAMDDFGAGYSSLLSLKNIPVDTVKIDREFVQGITEGGFNFTFIQFITELCHDVGKRVCLEGVETREQFEAVKIAGPELLQGFYYGRPVAADRFQEMFLSDEIRKI